MNLNIDLLCVIVNYGMGSKILHAAKALGISGGTVLMGRGTMKSRLLEILGLSDVRKEIVLMAGEREKTHRCMRELGRQFQFEKAHHGIAFIIPLRSIWGSSVYRDHIIENQRGEIMEYEAIFTIVNRGRGQEVMDAAQQAGARGGTIINARGSGIHETSTIFKMEIEPEKEVVLILCPTENYLAIVEKIRSDLNIDEPGGGIIFTQSVSSSFGLL